MNFDIQTLLMWSQFKDYMFYEAKHYYTYKGKRVSTSVTQFVSSLCEPFDKDTLSKQVAEKQGKTQKEILDAWQRNADISCILGTMFHLRSELYAQGKQFDLDFNEAKKNGVEKEVADRMFKLIPLQDKFFKDIHNRLIPLKTEFTVGIDTVIAGNIDLLAWNEKEQQIQIWDYKTNKKIDTENSFGRKMLGEFSDLDDCEFCHYSVQLSIYKYILQRQLGISVGDCYLAYFNEKNNNYQILKCLDLTERVGKILEEKVQKDEK